MVVSNSNSNSSRGGGDHHEIHGQEAAARTESMISAAAGYDRLSEVKAFDESKMGVKGLVDAGITKVPRMFHQPLLLPDHDHNSEEHQTTTSVLDETQFSFPTIDLEGAAANNNKEPNRRQEIVDRIRSASESWGFFQVVNHGIPESVLEEMLNGGRRFFELDNEVKKQLYTRDRSTPFVYNTNYDLYTSPAANWRDTFSCVFAPNPPDPQQLPPVCRDILFEYAKEVMKLGNLLSELLSEALGLNPNHLKDMNCGDWVGLGCHCYPACPEPELTIGATKHSDTYFLTVLLQDQMGGLQVLHHNRWLDVPPLPCALVVNIGDLLQSLSNDKFISIEHRVVAKRVGPRFSVPCFFSPDFGPQSTKLYGPIKELLSEDNPPKYREITAREYVLYYAAKGLDGTRALPDFRLS